MLTDGQKQSIRLACGYSAIGTSVTSGSCFRLLLAGPEILDFRIENLSSNEALVVLSYLSTIAAIGTEDAQEKAQLLDAWRRRVCAFLGVLPGPGLEKESAA